MVRSVYGFGVAGFVVAGVVGIWIFSVNRPTVQADVNNPNRVASRDPGDARKTRMGLVVVLAAFPTLIASVFLMWAGSKGWVQ